MNRRNFQIGPGAASLLLIAVVLCMSVLGILSLVSARGDARLSERSATMAYSAAALNVQSERSMALLDATLYVCGQSLSASGQSTGEQDAQEAYLAAVGAALPHGMTLMGDTVYWQEASDDGRRIDCEAKIAPMGETPRARFTAHRLYTEIIEEDALWN